MFLLDTNVVSELRVGKRQTSSGVQRWASARPARELYLSVITVFELEMGVLSMERKDALQGRNLRLWVDALKAEFQPRMLPFSTGTAIVCAAFHVPNRKSYRDSMIAATAKEHGYTLATRNTQDFLGCGIELLNPWLVPE